MLYNLKLKGTGIAAYGKMAFMTTFFLRGQERYIIKGVIKQ